MSLSQNTIISVKVPIAWDKMTTKSKQRLRQIVARDTRIIRAFLGVIQNNEDILLTGIRKTRIDESKLHEITMTAIRTSAKRFVVQHDMKARFSRASQNEITECRKIAVANYESYLALRRKKGFNASHPCEVNRSGRIPRWIFTPTMFKLFQKKTTAARWWMNLRDSLDSKRKGKTFHERLYIPLKVSPFHENQFSRGEIKAAQIFKDREKKWWVTFAVRLPAQSLDFPSHPVAVLGIDLGIEKAVCTALVTPRKVSEVRFFKQKEKIASIKKYDDLVSKLQHEMHSRQNHGQLYDNLANKLRLLRTKRVNIARDYDRVLVRQLIDYITHLNGKYTLYIAIGQLKGIRHNARKKNGNNRRYRRMIHSWAFARITESLNHQLAQLGWKIKGKNARIRIIPEQWTSIICWRCGSKGRRPKQNLFICPVCGHKTNADRNGAINIASRLIMLTESLHSVRGLGKWATSAEAGRSTRLKARRKKSSSKGKPSLSQHDSVSSQRESAAVHYVQSDLLSFGDKLEMSDNDPAVVRTVETLTVSRNDTPTVRQEKEARAAGGTPSS